MHAKVSYITKKRYATPNGNIYRLSILQSIIEIADCWIPFTKSDIVTFANLSEVPFQNHADDSTCGSEKFRFHQRRGGCDLSIKDICLHKLPEIKKRTFKSALYSRQDCRLTLKAWESRFRVNLYVTHRKSDLQVHHIVFDHIVSVFNGFSSFRDFIVTFEGGKPIR